MEKVNYITKAQTIGIFLVVLGHCMPTSMLPWTPKPILWLYRFIYSFHMPFFMFLAGWLFFYTDAERKNNYSEFLLRKVQRLLVPYIFISSFAFFLKNMLPSFTERSISLSFKSYIECLIYPQRNPIIFFWFLPALFLIFIVAPVFKRVIRGNNGILIFSVGLLLACFVILRPPEIDLFNLSRPIQYLIFFYLGCVANYYKNKLNMLDNSKFMVAAFILLVVLNCLLINKVVHGALATSLSFITAVTGILFAFSLAHFFDTKKVKFFNYIDGYYYQIFLLSWFFQVFFRVLFQMQLLTYPFAFIAMFISGLILPVFVSKFVTKKIPVLKFSIGL